jgi:hypothetical protein
MVQEEVINQVINEAFLNSVFEIMAEEGYKNGLKKGALYAEHQAEFDLKFKVGMALKDEWGTEFLYECLGLNVESMNKLKSLYPQNFELIIALLEA